MSLSRTNPSTLSTALAAFIEATLANPLSRPLLESTSRFVGVVGLDGRLVYVNPYGVELGRGSRVEMLGKAFWELSGSTEGEAEALWRGRFEESARTTGPIAFGDRYAFEGGGSVAVSSELSALRDTGGALMGYLVVGVDADAAARVEQRLREEERMRELVFDQSFQLMAVLGPDGTIREVNDAIVRIGLSREEVLGHRLQDIALMEADGRERAVLWQSRLDALRTMDEPLRVIDLRREVSGRRQAYECSMTPVRDARGELEMVLMEFRDHTDRHEVEQRLRLSEEQFRAMAEALPHMAWIARGPDDPQYFAPRWADFTGRSIAQLLEEGIDGFVHPDDRAAAAGWRARSEGEAPLVFRMMRHDGVYRWMEAHIAAVPGPDGLTRWFGATLDITDRVESEREARRGQEQLEATLRLTGFGTYVWLIDEDRFSQDTQLEEILGIPMEAMKTGNAFELFFSIVHAEDREFAQRSVLGAMQPGGPDYDAEFRIIRPADGGSEERWVKAMGRVQFDERGEPLQLIGIFADITDDRLELEGRLRFQKMEAIGTLASGIAHDFNNVIGAILSYARVAEAELKVGESPASSIAEIARGALRAGDVVKRLLTFSRDDESRSIAFDLAAVVEEATTLVSPSLPSGVKIHARADAELPDAIGDPSQLHQVIVNLITNAGQAIGERGGTIDVVVSSMTVGERPTGIESTLEAGGYLCFVVKDDGPGMSEVVMRRIFDPFFTTKAASDGTGLGLAAAQSIVKRHGGSIAVESSPGHGARFTVHIPVASKEATGIRAAEPSGPLPNVPETVRVLFVDDEQALVRLAYRAMPYHGCEVTGFTDPREAAEAFEQDPGAWDALITDFSMPGLTGLDLTDRVRALRPDFPVVLTSGYMGGDAHADAVRRGVGAVVPKPCSIDALAAEVYRLVGR